MYKQFRAWHVIREKYSKNKIQLQRESMLTKLVLFILCYIGNEKAVGKLLDFDIALQDWVNKNYISSLYYLFSERISTVKMSNVYSSEIILHLSNCSRNDMPFFMVRKTNGCTELSKNNPDLQLKCVLLHDGFPVLIEIIDQPLHCYNAALTALQEIEELNLLSSSTLFHTLDIKQ
ncbi:hypothetical protein T4E_3561 [Trichinella pseudospiralis]|uniref:Uncharacterized protein n=1 Tax=Trichinella pseudospiralis TaxID=6337 RepID=A0A0V0YD06_TRIPS|nr:hypothetical protein T4E_3561 [Trichinella pseudospiralis]